MIVHVALYATGDVPSALKEFERFDFRLDDYRQRFGHAAAATDVTGLSGT